MLRGEYKDSCGLDGAFGIWPSARALAGLWYTFAIVCERSVDARISLLKRKECGGADEGICFGCSAELLVGLRAYVRFSMQLIGPPVMLFGLSTSAGLVPWSLFMGLSLFTPSSYTSEAYKAVWREYNRAAKVDLNNAEPHQLIATEMSRQLTEVRERYLRYAFREAFGDLVERHRLALCAAGGTATRTTARFSDLDLFIVSASDVATSPEYLDGMQRFRDLLTRDKFQCDIQHVEGAVEFDTTPLQKISSREKRELAEVRLAETYLSLLPSRIIDGYESTFTLLKARYYESLKVDARHLLSLWHKSVLLRWEQNPHAFDSAEFDSKNSKGALRESDVLEVLNLFTQAVGITTVLITPDEVVRARALREVLLRLKHQIHFLPPENGRIPNPEDKSFTGCTFDKLAELAGGSTNRDERLVEVASAREELGRISARVHRRVGDLLLDKTAPEFHQDELTTAFAAFKTECYAENPSEEVIFKRVIGVFAAWKEKLSRAEPHNLLRTLSGLEHEVLHDLGRLADVYLSSGATVTQSVGLSLRTIFESTGPRAPVLELMHRTGWLKLCIPEFQAAQRILTDKKDDPVTHARHALDLVRNLDSLLGHAGVSEKGSPHAELAHRFIEQPEILYLAALCHDFGHLTRTHPERKGHEERGAVAAYRIASSLGYSHNESYRVAWLVRNHHKLRGIARQAALTDDALGKRVNDIVLDPDSLTMLYALSAADYMSGPRQRNDHAMHQWLARAFKAGNSAMNLSGSDRDNEGQKHRIAQDYARSLNLSNSISMERVEAHLRGLPPSYLTELSSHEIVQHLLGISHGDMPYVHWINEVEDESADPSTTRLQRVVVVANDQVGLLARMCGGMPFPITEACIFTTAGGMACNVITCAVPRSMLNSDLIRYTKRLKTSLCEGELPSARFLPEYSQIMARSGRRPDVVSYEVTQVGVPGVGVQITVKGPDRKHLASLVSELFPGIVTAKFARGASGTVNDSFILSRGFSKRELRQVVKILNERAGILPQESV